MWGNVARKTSNNSDQNKTRQDYIILQEKSVITLIKTRHVCQMVSVTQGEGTGGTESLAIARSWNFRQTIHSTLQTMHWHYTNHELAIFELCTALYEQWTGTIQTIHKVVILF